MKGKAIIFVLLVSLVLVSAMGCSRVRTYTVEKDRMDQDLSGGNAGYMSGTPGAAGLIKERKATRTTYVTEVELGFPAKKTKKSVSSVRTIAEEPQEEATIAAKTSTVVPASEPPAVTSYTVQDNDTLQKISLKVYGTTKKWNKIYEANKDKLKSPDRIYKGQVLRIP